jgi:hypothetical protein
MTRIARWAFVVPVFLAACGSDSGDGHGSASAGLGLPRASTVASLTAEQGVQLCDWINQVEGGYGRTVNCAATGPMATNANQMDCVSSLPDFEFECPLLTVAQLEDCTTAEGTDLCKYNTDPACAPLRLCFSCDPG